MKARVSCIFWFSAAVKGTPMGDSKHICFYSNRCQWSKAFIEEISKTPWKAEFRYICVDPSPNRPALPAWLKQTPTLVVQGEGKPRTDGEVMNWLYERKQKSAPPSSRQQASADPAAGGEPMAWNRNELGLTVTSAGSSMGSYSFLDADKSTAGNAGASLPGTYSFLNGQAAASTTAVDMYPGNSGGGGKKTKREEMFDQQMSDYMQNRDKGMQKGPARQ